MPRYVLRNEANHFLIAMLLLGRWAFVQPLPSCGCTNQLPYLCGKKSVFQCNETWKQRRSVVCGIWACVSDKVPLLTYYHIRPLQRHVSASYTKTTLVTTLFQEILQFTNICNECFYTSPIWKLLLRPIFFGKCGFWSCNNMVS